MKFQETCIKCQLPCLPKLYAGDAEVPPESFRRKVRLLLRRKLNARQVRAFKMNSSNLFDRFLGLIARNERPSNPETVVSGPRLETGDLVRVRSEEEIKATLNHWGQLRGCMFMPEMIPYCGTTQRVLKRMNRFLDERDYKVKKCQGIILLEGLNCRGTSDYGQCDRACFYFWREEWLEKIDGQE